MASGRRPRRAARAVSSATGGASATFRSAPRVSAAASAISGSRPRKTYRQPAASPTVPAIAGPITPGRTHAVESIANMRGRRCSGRVRPMATYAIGWIVPAPRPWTKRAATRKGMVGARPPDQEADGEQSEARGERDREAAPVDRAADHDDPDERAEEERREDPAVELEPAELVRDDGHDRRDRQRLEADQGDGQDEAQGQGATIGAPEAVLRVAGRAVHAQRMAGIAEALPRPFVAGPRWTFGRGVVPPAFDHRPARRSTIGASSSTSPSITELIPSRSRSPTSFATRPSIEPMNRCGDSRTSSEVSSTPVRPRR